MQIWTFSTVSIVVLNILPFWLVSFMVVCVNKGFPEKHKKALIKDSNNAKIHSNLGNTYMRKGMLDEAIAEFRQALSINPNLAGAHINLGNAYTKNGMLEEAIIEYKKALTINPNLVEAHTNLSVVYYTKKNYKLAILHCDKIVQLKGMANPKLLKLLEPYR